MSWLEIPHDKRHAMRVPSRGTVVLRRHEQKHRGRIVDLATGGVAIRCTPVTEHVGDVVALDIALDRGATLWDLTGHIVRVEDTTIAVAFDDIPLELEDYIHNELLHLVEHLVDHDASIDVIALPDTIPESVVEDLREILLSSTRRGAARGFAKH